MKRETPECPDCGNLPCDTVGELPASAFFAGKSLPAQIPGGKLYKCPRCRLRFRWPILDKVHYDRLYDNAESTAWQVSSLRTDQRLIVDYINTNFEGASVLDFGCYSGALLAALDAKFQKFGVEINKAAAARARSVAGAVVYSDINRIPKNAAFDVIVSSDVIEHFASPARFVESLLTHLKPGGSLLITTGDADAPLVRIFGERWWYYSFPEHIAFVSKRWLEHFCQKWEVTITHFGRFNYLQDSSVQRVRRLSLLTLYFLVGSKPMQWLRRIRSLWLRRQLTDQPSVPGIGVSQDHIFFVLTRFSSY